MRSQGRAQLEQPEDQDQQDGDDPPPRAWQVPVGEEEQQQRERDEQDHPRALLGTHQPDGSRKPALLRDEAVYVGADRRDDGERLEGQQRTDHVARVVSRDHQGRDQRHGGDHQSPDQVGHPAFKPALIEVAGERDRTRHHREDGEATQHESRDPRAGHVATVGPAPTGRLRTGTEAQTRDRHDPPDARSAPGWQPTQSPPRRSHIMYLRKKILFPGLVPAALLGLAAAAGPAAAAPYNGNTFVLDLHCSNGADYAVTIVDNSADPAPAHLVDSTSVLIPTAFQFHIIVIDADGNVVDEVTPLREIVRGMSGEQHDTMSCSFAQTETDYIPGVGEVTLLLDGTVDAYQAH
jgi:hypothetical protein